ncbi:hypothetical protein TNCV_242851 [Trichonephila clavipes]|uniref:Uncharacterized protein n=1 Tax=Trichonephila clavipes TaxID=2585209 RepID=A0A8X6W4B1_TRICX|nr:hypothetical protein TNCV_242851 [Trichonephila clavipes]
MVANDAKVTNLALPPSSHSIAIITFWCWSKKSPNFGIYCGIVVAEATDIVVIAVAEAKNIVVEAKNIVGWVLCA